MKKIILLAILVSFLTGLNLEPGQEKHIFFGFSEKTETWAVSGTPGNCAKKTSISGERILSGSGALKTELDFPGEGFIEKDFFKDFSAYSSLVLNVFLPGGNNSPDDLRISVLLQDNELLWYQTQSFPLSGEIWNRLTLDVSPKSAFWESIGHKQPWSEKPSSGIRKIGVKFFSSRKSSVSVYIDEVSGIPRSFPEHSASAETLKAYEKFEISFYAPGSCKNPFDPEEIEAKGVFTCPDGKDITVPGFYFQEYSRLLENGEEKLLPVGYPHWKIRFTPRQAGTYRYTAILRTNAGELKSCEGRFTALPPGKPGFVGISSLDKRYFAFDNGDFFYPVGLNVRSPTDTRYDSLMKKKAGPDGGSFYYDQVFSRMSQNGMNFAEIWLAPWFSALEWKENRPGYRNLGYYNLGNAYKIDRILESAEKHGIFLQVVIINHGQLSTWCDREWQDNPYNESNGGFLKRPDDFFTDKRARESFRRQLGYILARWSYSPNIFSWEIMNEMNLTGSRSNFYSKEEKTLSDWFGEMKEYIGQVDVFKHLVTGHYTILAKSRILSELADYTITNGYYDMRNAILPSFLDSIYLHHSGFNKPAFVSEFGGTSGGSSVKNLERDIIVGLWYGYHKHFAATPMFWWHGLVMDRDLFDLYRVFSEYSSGNSRFFDSLETGKTSIEGPGNKQISSITLENDHFASCWVYNFAVTRDMDGISLPPMSGMKALIGNKKNGRYRVTFYDMEKGIVDETVQDHQETEGRMKVSLPPFTRWIAFKAELE